MFHAKNLRRFHPTLDEPPIDIIKLLIGNAIACKANQHHTATKMPIIYHSLSYTLHEVVSRRLDVFKLE